MTSLHLTGATFGCFEFPGSHRAQGASLNGWFKRRALIVERPSGKDFQGMAAAEQLSDNGQDVTRHVSLRWLQNPSSHKRHPAVKSRDACLRAFLVPWPNPMARTNELEGARFQGRHVAQITARLTHSH